MNTALLTAKIHFHGSFWIVIIGDKSHVCLNKIQLLDALAGKPHRHPEPAPPPTTETVEQFLTRGGAITYISRPKTTPLPPAKPEPVLKTPSRITLADLGF